MDNSTTQEFIGIRVKCSEKYSLWCLLISNEHSHYVEIFFTQKSLIFKVVAHATTTVAGGLCVSQSPSAIHLGWDRGYYYDLQNLDQIPPEVESISVPNGTETLVTWLVWSGSWFLG